MRRQASGVWTIFAILMLACEAFIQRGGGHVSISRACRWRVFARKSAPGTPLIERLQPGKIEEHLTTGDYYAPWRALTPEATRTISAKERFKTLLRHQEYMGRWLSRRSFRGARTSEATELSPIVEQQIDETFDSQIRITPPLDVKPPGPFSRAQSMESSFPVDITHTDTTMRDFTPQELYDMEYDAVKRLSEGLQLNLTEEQLHEVTNSNDFPNVRVPAFETGPILFPAPRESFSPGDEYGPLTVGFDQSYWHSFLRDPKTFDDEGDARKERSEKKVFIGQISRNATSEEVFELAQQFGHVVNYTFIPQEDRRKSKWHAAYIVYNTTEEAAAAVLSVRNNPLHGKRMFARLLAPIKEPPKPRFDPTKLDPDDDADLYVSARIRKLVDSLNITAIMPSPKPKHEYLDYEAFNYVPKQMYEGKPRALNHVMVPNPKYNASANASP